MLREVVAIVLIGVVLGVAFNVLETSSTPSRGLPWVATLEPLESAEDLAFDVPNGSVPSTASGESAMREPVHPEPEGSHAVDGADETAEPTARGAPAGEAGARADVANDGAPSPSDEAETPSPEVAASEVAPAVDLPVIPDVGRPLRVGRKTVARFVDADAALVVDARERAAFAESHIPGAINVPYLEATADPTLLEGLDSQGRPTIVYCSGEDCTSSRMLAELMMQDFGMRRVLVYESGFPDWVAAGRPVNRGRR